MLSPGLLSITFRKLSPRDIVALIREAGLRAIEWGGDVHVPPGNPANAREVRQITEDAGLATAAYGSYYRLCTAGGPDFSEVLEASVALGAPQIRVWAGNKGTFESDDAHFHSIVAEARRLADLAEKAGILLAFEFHGGTVNDTYAASKRLLAACAHPAIATYWQPPLQIPEPEALDGLGAILPDVRDIHVFNWTVGPSGIVRHPLSEGAALWNRAFHVLRGAERDRSVMLEFVRDDSIEAFREDARALLSLLGS
ncbi:MAG: sugar phosphate isomerase/epimerase [Verrucomicrobiae bacterium]